MEDAPAEVSEPVGLTARLELLEGSVAALADLLSTEIGKLQRGMLYLIDDDPRARRRLADLRASPAYEEAFIAPDPLVSVLIPTYNRTESLVGRAIPSVLAQSHANVEVVVVGDAAPAALVQAVAELDDPRVRFHNLTVNGPYEAERYAAWSASGTPPLNAALARARGLWMTALGDDDEMPPRHIEMLLEFARSRRVEFVYGRLRIADRGGKTHRTDTFPPSEGHINLQSSLWHAGLRFLEFELGQSVFGVPNDWGLIERMMRVGVTIAQTDSTTVDWVPSHRDGTETRPSPAAERRVLHREIATLQDRVTALEHERDALSERLVQRTRDAREAEDALRGELAAIRDSRAWRVAAALRGGNRP